MIIRHSRDSEWLSNSWLVADKPGGHAVLIDTGGPQEPLLAAIEEFSLTPTHILNTHHHHDHVTHNHAWADEFSCPVCGHSAEQELIPGLTQTLADGEEVRSGSLVVRALHIPGHTAGQLAFLVNEKAVFTGDTLFRDSVGGTRAPGHTTFEEMQHSVMERLMKLPKQTEVYPGHMDPSTIAREWEENPFLRKWRGLDQAAASSCLAFGNPAKLLLRARDYDGGTKCWVRFEDGREDLVPGSRVKDLA
ncbi:MAG: MBL fold metallo-hydrolase [Planctomycetota bacterium]|nr:MBL fold metallo-hydrolase [Planctomycetota bacterium]MDA1114094.1 MBL fold metallo-hydrolase [Planctomycetota bacterium]